MEQQFGRRLPELLREFYLRVAKRPDLMGIGDHFEPLEKLSSSIYFPGYLDIYSENQGCFHFSVDLNHPNDHDPLVFFDSDASDGMELHGRLSSFLIYAVYLHALDGAAGIAAIGDVDARMLRKVEDEWEFVGQAVTERPVGRLYTRPGKVVEIWEHEGAPAQVQAGARSEADLAEIARSLGIPWNRTWRPR